MTNTCDLLQLFLDLPDLLCLPGHLLAGPLLASQVHRGEACHRHDHPPHTHLHVLQRAQDSISFISQYLSSRDVVECRAYILKTSTESPYLNDGILDVEYHSPFLGY